ncbi:MULTISPECIES: dissimilatory sulfite reductase D family protein [Archaeoglobus]|jgi:Mn-dependent DtxR family transcriptional regulator|uniref:Protein DsrD n=3 Tax=Archaeoglobus fulgidus TaxID=2234 RepID=DSRD_ARCFU|nr:MULTISPECIES: dissimilatory sulfite reductase D family protein [Archaeoglobus]P70742.2 RecName: Full=Protein DsrD [Archaeoglobus fulgidus DSM 4304]AAB90817.1 sulfite reductase, subunit gamma (dsrD) [Archaeoglobus fulgidus DSM 4304]AIG97243.1 Dissimilatory sulfite reductase D (DsrD) [Archaeoglobus fulgidus DSM 8774]AIG98867.1 Dissimilatory sulfite reductase D (DsrD) [Archaeoglobus fulgidus DSM 8774]KUJ92419.1 MAG: Protein DsrD [Archaeoglobus fulgidus]KUK05360.1 MAG: Protein DsrD [Archaeoglo
MADYTEEDKQKVLAQLSKKTWKIPELAKILKMDKKVVKKIVQDLINEGVAGYWSSGSTTYVATKEYIEELEKKRAEG